MTIKPKDISLSEKTQDELTNLIKEGNYQTAMIKSTRFTKDYFLENKQEIVTEKFLFNLTHEELKTMQFKDIDIDSLFIEYLSILKESNILKKEGNTSKLFEKYFKHWFGFISTQTVEEQFKPLFTKQELREIVKKEGNLNDTSNLG